MVNVIDEPKVRASGFTRALRSRNNAGLAFVGTIIPLNDGAPDRIRTCDLRLRRASLYPAELRVRAYTG